LAICTAIDANAAETDDDAAIVDTGIAAEYGLQITKLAADGLASAAGLKERDVILSVGEIRVQGVEDLQSALTSAAGDAEVVYIDGDSGETLMPSRINASVTFPTASVEKNSPEIGLWIGSVGC
jgi:S1-C subfamily serine protease